MLVGLDVHKHTVLVKMLLSSLTLFHFRRHWTSSLDHKTQHIIVIHTRKEDFPGVELIQHTSQTPHVSSLVVRKTQDWFPEGKENNKTKYRQDFNGREQMENTY